MDRVGKVVVGAAGYLGDVAPYVPIANELVDRGHDVTFLAPPGFHRHLAGERFRFAPYALDFSPDGMRDDDRHTRLMRHPLRNTVGLGRYMMAKAYADDPAAARASMAAALEGADVLLTHPAFATLSQPLAQAQGVPTVFGHLFPMLLPTRAWGPATPDRHRDLGPLNGPAWGAGAVLAHLAFRGRAMARLQRDLGQEPLGMMRIHERADRTVMLVSRQYYGEPAPDWPAMTWGGFSRWLGPSGHRLDPALEAFVEDGEPPVLVTLGTSAALNAGEQFAEIARGLDALGLRSVILAGGPENLGPLHGRPGVVEFAPITELLPRCRAVVLSGALGGVAAALHAGVPMVVHPQLVDQRWHARRVQDLGLGLAASATRRVARAIGRVVSNPGFTDRARAMAARVALEDGARVGADVVEELLV